VRLLVYGLGRSGGAVVARAVRDGQSVAFVDRRSSGADIDAALALGAERAGDVAGWLASLSADGVLPKALCVAAPGVPVDHPDLQHLRAAGVEVIGEVEWMSRRMPARIVGVTGTAGKGSVTRWLADTLIAAGVDALAGGNLEPALAAVARPDATWVVELSSFQLERCPTLKPDVAVVLNLGVDHLDRHGDVTRYHAAKRAILANLGPEQAFVFDAGDAALRAWAAATPARLLPYATTNDAAAALRAELGRDPAASVHLIDDGLRLGHDLLLRASELRVSGRHQHGNALAVALAAQALGLPRGAIVAGLRQFRGLPGRYALVGRLGDVAFIEDSIATRELAVAAALAATPAPLVWLAGGVDKGADLRSLEPLVRERVSLLLGIGRSGPGLVATVGAWTRAERVDQPDGRQALRAAVRRGWAHLVRHHGGHGSVLLAPLAASFDQFHDYADRAAAFRAAVHALASEVGSEACAALGVEGATWIPCC
jgi:UDP-N-acetylmuramoylalanine--D-glutamate ligase